MGTGVGEGGRVRAAPPPQPHHRAQPSPHRKPSSSHQCPYSQRVWLQLEEKAIPYTLQKINMRCYGPKPPDYTAKGMGGKGGVVGGWKGCGEGEGRVWTEGRARRHHHGAPNPLPLRPHPPSSVPSGLLPAIEIDGKLLTESAVIMQVLEDAFPENTPLRPPAGTRAAARHDALLRLERNLFGDWLGWLVQPWGGDAARAAFYRTLGAVEGALAGAEGGGPYFMGPELSLADLVFAPFLERIVASIPYYKGEPIRGDR